MHSRLAGGLRAFAAAALVALSMCATLSGARAQSTVLQYDTLDAPVVRIIGQRGAISVRTWDRSQISVETKNDDPIDETRGVMRFGADPRSIPIPAQNVARPNGALVLPPEEFVVSGIAPGPHDVYVVRTHFAAATVTVPANTALLIVNSGGGALDVDGYRNGTFIVASRNAAIALHNMGGNGFVQTINGTVNVTDSTLDRIRARSVTRDLRFERCSVKQIEATSFTGNITYDAGTFSPGLARFASQSGNVAIGVDGGGVAIGAHTPQGRVYSSFSRDATVAERPGEASATVGGGGPLVTATSERGSIYLYDGSLRAKRNLSADWNAPLRALTQPRAIEAAPARFPRMQRIGSPAPQRTIGPRPETTVHTAPPRPFRSGTPPAREVRRFR